MSDAAVSDAAVIGASLAEPARFAVIFDRHVAAISGSRAPGWVLTLASG
jgi:hypothetical protein